MTLVSHDHVPESIDPLLLGSEPREPESTGIRNMDSANRGCLRRDIRPHPEC